MTEHEGFLERMLGPLGQGTQRRQVRWVGDPIRVHLTMLLNTRQGSVPSQPDYGLPDVTSFFSEYPTSLADLRVEVERAIRTYEPRLENAHVRLIESDGSEFRASFLIVGEIEDERTRTRVQYRTTITSTGRAEMTGG